MPNITSIMHLPLNLVVPNPCQPRRIFDVKALDELAQSIKIYGVLQPISVRRTDLGYELVAGERRLRASRLAGMQTIPAVLVQISDTDSAVLAIIENLQRQNLHFFEEAEGYANLIGEYSFTQDELARRIGKTQSTIANKLRLLRLPRNLRDAIIMSDLTERHARALLKLESPDLQESVLQKVIANGLNVKKTEDLIEASLTAPIAPPKKTAKTIPFKAHIRDIRILTNSIQENLEIVRRGGMKAEYDLIQTETGYNISITLTHAHARNILHAEPHAQAV